MGKFTVEEINFICVFGGKNRKEILEDIGRVFPYLQDSEMEELAERVIEKLQNMTDEAFLEVALVAAE